MALCLEDRRSSPLDGILQPELYNNCLSAPTGKNSICVLVGSRDVLRSRSIVTVDHCTNHMIMRHCQLIPLDTNTSSSCCIDNSMQFFCKALFFIIVVVVVVIVCSIFIACVWLLLFLCYDSNWNFLIKKVFFVSFSGYLD